jgi:uncharacterized protein
LPALVARVTYRLPYCWASMTIEGVGAVGGQIRYTSRRRWPSGEASSVVTVRVGEAITEVDETDLDRFLTARWALGSTWGRRLMWARVDHPIWPLHHADLLECDETTVRAAGLPIPTGVPHVRWSPGVDVRIERPRLVRPALLSP